MEKLKTGIWAIKFGVVGMRQYQTDASPDFYRHRYIEDVFGECVRSIARGGEFKGRKACIYADRYWTSKPVQLFIQAQIKDIVWGPNKDSFEIKGDYGVIVRGWRFDHYRCGTPFNHGP
jgi:hypothetical protein